MKKIDFEVIDSTNLYLKNNYQKLDNMTFVSSRYQTLGRGRNNRIWTSEKGKNLLFSLLLSDTNYFDKYGDISIISAYSVCEVLKEYDIDAKIKWPNDVFVGDKKIAGILLESISKDNLLCLIVGVGINVNQKEFCKELLINPTSITNEINKDIDLDIFKEKIYSSFEKNLLKILLGHDFYDDISRINYLKDKEVYASINGDIKKIKVIDINKDYSLKIEVDHEIIDLISGEISFHI